MDVDLIFRIAAIGILVAVLNQVLSRAGRDEQAMLTTLAGLVVVLMMVVQEIALLLALAAGLWMLGLAAGGLAQLAALMEELAGMAGLSEEILEPLFKVVAISILTRLAVEICRGAGENGVAAFLETAGTVASLAAALPLARAVTTLMAEIL